MIGGLKIHIMHLHNSNPQPQAEKGYFVQSRFEFIRPLTAEVEWGSWIRKADNSQYYKIVTKLEWKPLFNYRIKFRYKIQSRGSLDVGHPSHYSIQEGRITFKINLSNYDNVEFLYSWNYMYNSPKPRLSDDVGSPETGLGFQYIHNFNKYLSIKSGIVYVGGYMWYIEDNDFRMFDTNSGLVHSWLSFNVKPNSDYIINFKVSYSSDSPYTTIPYGETEQHQLIENPYVHGQNFNYKIQINYAL